MLIPLAVIHNDFKHSRLVVFMIITIFAKETSKIRHMHFVLSYDLGASGERRVEIENQIEQILAPYRHVKRLTTFYIVHITVASEWDTILSKMSELSQSVTESLHFIMSPPMPSGSRYNGMLNRGDWNEINDISNL